jgi:hypothetical protein
MWDIFKHKIQVETGHLNLKILFFGNKTLLQISTLKYRIIF